MIMPDDSPRGRSAGQPVRRRLFRLALFGSIAVAAAGGYIYF